jgi:microsomal dipeptidase-like Zn-dependent dipeptidase
MPALRTRAALLALALGLVVPAGATPAAAADRYALANGCYALWAAGAERFVVKTDDGWRATATDPAAGEAFRMQASALGRYLLMARDGSFLVSAGDGPAAATRGGRARVTAAPDADGDWRLDEQPGDTFTLTAASNGQKLAVGGSGDVTSGASATPFAFVAREGCATFPEAEVNVAGQPYRGPTSFGETKGLIETHLHAMAFEFIGGSVRCGRPWHPLGISAALIDCPDHGPGGQGAALENTLAYGNPAQGHDTDGWPSFTGWPHHQTYTHEQVYYKWLERAWRGGLRLWTNLLVDNEVLCEVYPLKRNPCDEMHNVRLQRQRIDELVDYIDAQSGGPGKGWLRIVRDPFEARRVINEGKLALVLGIETSKLFDCGEVNRRPTCDRATIDRYLEEFHRLGIRQMELVNKFDNGLVGVIGDAGETGIATNAGNRYDTGHFWAMTTCMGPTAEHDHDKEQVTGVQGTDRDALAGGILSLFLPTDATPIYPPAPHCNQQGLTQLGAYLVRRMMGKKMIFDPDHMSTKGRDQAMAIIESANYGGVVSSHSWASPDTYRRILRLGGVVTPAPKTVSRFLEEWRELKPQRNRRFLYGTGWSTDMNGFAAQGGPRPDSEANPLRYPFRSLDGSTVIDRNRTGTRTWDLNTDGVAHFGMYPDIIEDVRRIGGDEPAQDLLNGAEAYLQMWERAQGIRGPQCRAAQRRFLNDGLGEIRIGQRPERLLWTAGQPQSRPGRVWTWCAHGSRGGQVRALLTQDGRVEVVGSTARLHRHAGIGPGSRASRLNRHWRRWGPDLRVRRAGRSSNRVVHGIRRGRVTFTAVVSSRTAGASPARLRAALRTAGLR